MTTDVIDFDAARAAKAQALIDAAGGFVRGDHAEIADALLAKLATDRRLVRYAEGAVHVYDPTAGIWRARTRDELRAVIKGFAGAPKGESGVLKISLGAADGAIAFACADVADPDFFGTTTPGVAFGDGFVQLDNGKIVLREHSPDHRARAGFRFAYDPKAPHPKRDVFLFDIFADASEDDRADRIALLQEFIGACLCGIATTYQQALVLFGQGGNGKSEVQRLARAVMPKGTVTSLAPQAWGERFKVEKLAGKLANLADEIPEREIVGGDTFKSVISGEPLTAERKFQDAFTFAPRAGHIFAANSLPGTADHSEGFWRRLVVLPFTRRFDNAAERRPEAAKEIVETELPALVAWAVEGAARLQRQGHYTIPESAVQALDEWRTSADSVASFVAEKTRPVDRSADTYAPGTPASRLYSTYREWAEKSGLRPVSSKEFARRMGSLGKHAVRRAAGVSYPVELTSEVTL